MSCQDHTETYVLNARGKTHSIKAVFPMSLPCVVCHMEVAAATKTITVASWRLVIGFLSIPYSSSFVSKDLH